MLDDWEPFKWNLEKWNNLFKNQQLDCRKGLITCTKVNLNIKNYFIRNYYFYMYIRNLYGKINVLMKIIRLMK